MTNSTAATSTVTMDINTTTRNCDKNIGATLNDTYVFDLKRLRANCRNSYSKEELDEYDSDSDDGSYEDMPGLRPGYRGLFRFFLL